MDKRLELEAAVVADITLRAMQFSEALLVPLKNAGLSASAADENDLEAAVFGVLSELRHWAATLESKYAPFYADIRVGEAELERLKQESKPQGVLFGFADRFWNWYFRRWVRIREGEAKWRKARRRAERQHQAALLNALTAAGVSFSVAEQYSALLVKEAAST